MVNSIYTRDLNESVSESQTCQRYQHSAGGVCKCQLFWATPYIIQMADQTWLIWYIDVRVSPYHFILMEQNHQSPVLKVQIDQNTVVPHKKTHMNIENKTEMMIHVNKK